MVMSLTLDTDFGLIVKSGSLPLARGFVLVSSCL